MKPGGFQFDVFAQRLHQWHVDPDDALAPSAPLPPVDVVVDPARLSWCELKRGSGRARVARNISGILGEVTLAGDLASSLPSLLWGTLTGVGNSASYGNGYYRMEVGA